MNIINVVTPEIYLTRTNEIIQTRTHTHSCATNDDAQSEPISVTKCVCARSVRTLYGILYYVCSFYGVMLHNYIPITDSDEPKYDANQGPDHSSG